VSVQVSHPGCCTHDACRQHPLVPGWTQHRGGTRYTCMTTQLENEGASSEGKCSLTVGVAGPWFNFALCCCSPMPSCALQSLLVRACSLL
jgi:hypothetical protein